jgi:hypothetical protein
MDPARHSCQFILHGPFEALRGAFNTSSEVERLFLEIAAAFDFNRRAILRERMSTRMCTKMHGRMTRRHGLPM